MSHSTGEGVTSNGLEATTELTLERRSRETGATIGTYHPKAGMRSTGGVAVFVREMVRNLEETRETYLYTEEQGITAERRDEDATTVPVRTTTALKAFGALSSLSPVTLHAVSNQLGESVSTFAKALRGGAIDHVERNVDVLFTHTLLDTVLLSNATSVPVVRVFHGCQHTSKVGRAVAALSRPAATVANSDQTATEVETKLGREVDWTVYPGVDLESFSPDRQPAFDREEVSVLFAGRFTEAKGVYDLLVAFDGLPDQTHLYLAGRGETERVRREVRRRGLRNRVTVLGDVPYHELPEYYVAADVACLPTHYDSFCMVNVEAMACETPVVTSDIPGVKRYATDGENAVLVPPGRPARLREELRTLVESPERRRAIGSAGRSVAEEFSWEATAERFADVADAVAKRS